MSSNRWRDNCGEREQSTKRKSDPGIGDPYRIGPRYRGIVYSGDLSGTGQLLKGGCGTLIITGDNTFTGGTWIYGGTLQLGTQRPWMIPPASSSCMAGPSTSTVTT